ncbi:MAG: S8 family serine peptidase, partial [candidate division NC10 bacterium]|nr:S8 family serine peptidase [candidate division NC10 bacterium]
MAVIDSGVDYNHEDLSSNMWQNPNEIAGNGVDDDANGKIDDIYGWDFYDNDNDPMDDDGHGTQVAGVIAARGNNGKGISGVAWYGKIMALRCHSDAWGGYIWSATQAIAYALDIKQRYSVGRMILNFSWTSDWYSQALYDAVKAAMKKGVLVVASTAYWTQDHDLYPRYPACFDLENIISVGPSNRFDKPDSYGYGPSSVDLHAPGSEIWSTSPGNSYGINGYSSSSLAAAHVTGAAALVWSYRSSSGYRVIKGLILNGVESGQVPGAFKGRSVSEGRLNLNNSLKDDLLDDPAIFSVTPNRAWIGDTITIRGVNFGTTTGTLRFAGTDFPAGSIDTWGNSQIVATIPTGLPKQEGRIQVITSAGTSRGAYFAHGWLESLVGHTLIPRTCSASAQVSGSVWILGGWADWGKVTGIVEKHDLADHHSTIDSHWTMPTPVSFAGAAAIGSKIYVVGGLDAQGNYPTTLQIFDTATKTWSTGADAPTIFYLPAVVSYGGKLYVFGGAGAGESVHAYSYDPVGDAWMSLADMPQATLDAAAAPIGTTGQILVMGGGYANGGERSVTQIYNVNTDSWTLGPDLKKARAGAGGTN